MLSVCQTSHISLDNLDYMLNQLNHESQDAFEPNKYFRQKHKNSLYHNIAELLRNYIKLKKNI